MTNVDHLIVVSCTCRKGTLPGFPRMCAPFACRPRWTTDEVLRAWYEGHRLLGIDVPFPVRPRAVTIRRT